MSKNQSVPLCAIFSKSYPAILNKICIAPPQLFSAILNENFNATFPRNFEEKLCRYFSPQFSSFRTSCLFLLFSGGVKLFAQIAAIVHLLHGLPNNLLYDLPRKRKILDLGDWRLKSQPDEGSKFARSSEEAKQLNVGPAPFPTIHERVQQWNGIRLCV